MKFRNIRVKMKGGKSRIQRAMVLASGKLKFVKNVTRSKSSRKARHNPNSGGKTRKMGKRKHRGGGKSFQRSVFKLLRGGALVAPAIIDGMSYSGTTAQKFEAAIMPYGGINMNRQFEWDALTRRWTPFVVTSLATYGIPKLVALIRRI